MSKDKIYLGTDHNDDKLWLEKHSWDCKWYWGFGYIGNNHLHMHISALINHPEKYDDEWTNITRHFSDTWINQTQWWILRDLFLSAYALKKTAEVYHHGSHQTQMAIQYTVINEKMVKIINHDLNTMLDNIWNILHEWHKDWKQIQRQKSAA